MAHFPPLPPSFVGRAAEVRELTARLTSGRVGRLALLGAGGSGKSLLACAVGHRCRPAFPGGVHWFRVGGWDAATLKEMLARRLDAPPATLTDALSRRGRSLVVLDNHENDRALARFLDELRACPVVWLVTARRCLLSGVEIFPVVPPLSTTRGRAFPRVAALTDLLRSNPLALDIADNLVRTRAISARALEAWLREAGVDRVTVMANEDDLPEVRLLVDWAWARLPPAARRMLAVLASCEGDDVDEVSLGTLARGSRAALGLLRRWHLVQEPLAGRYTVHAVVREAVKRKQTVPPERFFRHYVPLLERHPERIALEQTHLFAAMDHAHRASSLGGALRVSRLAEQL